MNNKQIGTIVTGHVGYQILMWLFDYVLYTFVILILGLFYGWIVMTILSVITSFILILLYDKIKIDLFGFETLKTIVKEEDEVKGLKKFFLKLIKKSEVFAFFILSIWFDPFITTIYLRKSEKSFNGMGKKDWRIFILSSIFANAYWSIFIFTGITAIQFIYQLVYNLI